MGTGHFTPVGWLHVFFLSFLPSTPFFPKLCHDTTRLFKANDQLSRSVCDEAGGQFLTYRWLGHALLQLHSSSRTSDARRFPLFFYPGTGNRVAPSSLSLSLIALFFLSFVPSVCVTEKQGGRLLCRGKIDVYPSSALVCHVVLSVTSMILLIRDHHGRVTNPSACTIFSSPSF